MFSRATRLSSSLKLAGSVRRMGGGGHHAAPPKDGLEGFLRKYLPGDEHMALGVIGLYLGIYGIVKLTGGKKKEQVAAAPVDAHAHTHAAHGGDEMPSVDSPAFDKWLSTPGNFEKIFG
eukprot:gene36275-44003_t